MRRSLLFSFLLFFLASYSFAEKARLGYIAYDFEAFRISKFVTIDADINIQSVKNLFDRAKEQIEPLLGPLVSDANIPLRGPFESDLLLIGYGSTCDESNFFALTQSMDSELALKDLITSLDAVPRSDEGKWYFLFVNKNVSQYVLNASKTQKHFWGSPFLFLDTVGRQPLQRYPLTQK